MLHMCGMHVYAYAQSEYIWCVNVILEVFNHFKSLIFLEWYDCPHASCLERSFGSSESAGAERVHPGYQMQGTVGYLFIYLEQFVIEFSYD